LLSSCRTALPLRLVLTAAIAAPSIAGAGPSAAAAAGGAPVVAGARSAAAAASGAPVPDCHGVSFADPAGELQRDGRSVPGNLDVVGGFFTLTPDGDTLANIVIKDLTTTPPPGALGVMWVMHVLLGGQPGFVYAVTDVTGGVSYGYQIAPDNTLRPTTGTLFPGPNGVVQINVGLGITGTAQGSTLQSPWAESAEVHQLQPPLIFRDPFSAATQADRLPETGAGTDYTFGGPCPSGGSGSGSGERVGGGPPAITVLTRSARVSRARDPGSLVIALRASTPMIGVTVKLLRGSDMVASTRLARMSGTARARLRPRHKLARGSYQVVVTAGSALTSTRLRAAGQLYITA
jgi:hypothetical protein